VRKRKVSRRSPMSKKKDGVMKGRKKRTCSHKCFFEEGGESRGHFLIGKKRVPCGGRCVAAFGLDPDAFTRGGTGHKTSSFWQKRKRELPSRKEEKKREKFRSPMEQKKGWLAEGKRGDVKRFFPREEKEGSISEEAGRREKRRRGDKRRRRGRGKTFPFQEFFLRFMWRKRSGLALFRKSEKLPRGYSSPLPGGGRQPFLGGEGPFQPSEGNYLRKEGGERH